MDGNTRLYSVSFDWVPSSSDTPVNSQPVHITWYDGYRSDHAHFNVYEVDGITIAYSMPDPNDAGDAGWLVGEVVNNNGEWTEKNDPYSSNGDSDYGSDGSGDYGDGDNGDGDYGDDGDGDGDDGDGDFAGGSSVQSNEDDGGPLYFDENSEAFIVSNKGALNADFTASIQLTVNDLQDIEYYDREMLDNLEDTKARFKLDSNARDQVIVPICFKRDDRC